MAKKKTKSRGPTETVKDIYFKDLPSSIQKDLVEIHQMIVAQCQETWKNPNFSDIQNSGWAKSMLDEFLTTPMGTSDVGSVRLYKKKNRYSCMIQITGHVVNQRDDIPHEIFHEFIRTVHQVLRTKVRKKFDMALTCESEHGERFEGMDVWTKPKVAKELWEHLEDVPSITKKEVMTESAESENSGIGHYTYDINALPVGLQNTIVRLNATIADVIYRLMEEPELQDLKELDAFNDLLLKMSGKTPDGSDIGYTEIWDRNGEMSGTIVLTPEISLKSVSTHAEVMANLIQRVLSDLQSVELDDTKRIRFLEGKFVLVLTPEYAAQIVNHANEDQPAMEFAWIPSLDDYFLMEAYQNAIGHEVFYYGESHLAHIENDVIYVEGLDQLRKALHTTKKVAAYGANGAKASAKLVGRVTNAISDTLKAKIASVMQQKQRFTLNEFLQRYHYDPSNSTILIDGVRIKVDIKLNEPLVKVNEQYIPRTTAATLNGDAEPTIIFHKSFFKLSKDEYQDAIVRHELAHAKYHSLNPDSSILDKRYIDETILKEILTTMAKQMDPIHYKKLVDAWLTDPSIHELIGKKVNDPAVNAILETILNRSKKYLSMTKNPHLNTSELMADGYAAARTSKEDLIGGLKEYERMITSPSAIREFIQGSMAANQANSRNTPVRRVLIPERPDPATFKVNPLLVGAATLATKASNRSETKARKKALYDQELQDAISKMESASEIVFDPYAEGAENYSGNMSTAEAKKTMRMLSQNLMKQYADDPKFAISQYTANTYANLITQNLLASWAPGYRKFSIQVGERQSFFTVEFKLPSMTRDFISRYVEGRENLDGFLHQTSEIKVKISPRVFSTMKTPDDAFQFFRAMIRYYHSGLTKCADRMFGSLSHLNRELKYLISSTKLSGLIILPFTLLTTFDDVHMDRKDTFKVSNNEIKAINSFFRSIYANYASPSKERTKILDDMKALVRQLQEPFEESTNIQAIQEAVDAWEHIDELRNSPIWIREQERWVNEQVDWDQTYNYPDLETRLLMEKHRVKKLKKIPRDLVAYITIEAESIQDANDKMMIASYCLGKIEIVEWYIEILDSGTPDYIVPHTRSYLEELRTQLLNCYKKIMDVKITPPSKRPIIQVDYPAGLEG